MKPIVLSLSILLLSSVFAVAQGQEHKKDSLRNVIYHATEGEVKRDALYALITLYRNEARFDASKRDTLYALYKDLEADSQKHGDDKMYGVAVVNKCIDLSNFGAYDEVVKLAPDYLKIFEKKQVWRRYYALYRSYCEAVLVTANEKVAFDVIEKMYEFAKAKEHKDGMGLAFFGMSRIYEVTRRFEEQEQSLRECIHLIRDSLFYANLLFDAYRRLGYSLVAQQKYDAAVQIADEASGFTKQWDEREKRVDPNRWRLLWNVYLDAYRQAGNWDQAELYAHKIDSITGGKYNIFEAKAFIALSKKKYTEALEMIDKAIEMASPVAQLSPRASKLTIWLQAHGSEGVKMDSLYKDILNRLEAKHSENTTAQIDRIRTEYEVDKIQAQKKRLRTILTFSLGLCILLTITLGIWIYYSRMVVKKNRGLYHQIKEQEHLANELEAMTKRYDEWAQAHLQSNDAEEERSSEPQAQPSGTWQQRQLVSRLRDYLLLNKHFVKSELDNQELIAALATNRTYLFQALKTVTGKTPFEFITAMRLEEAKRMLESEFNFSLDEVYEQCGFNSRSAFYRLFQEQYRIAPAQYRKAALREKRP